MRKAKYYIVIIFCSLTFLKSQSQTDEQKVLLVEVLKEISNTHNITFNHESSLLKAIKVRPLPKRLSLFAKIRNLEKQTGLIFNKISDYVITISKPIKVCGYIKEAQLNKPLLGVTIHGKSGYSISDENGYFEIELHSIDEFLTLRHLGFKTIERQASFFNLEKCEAVFMFEQEEVMSPILLNAYLVRGIDKRQDWTTSIDYNKFSLLPGLIESDVLKTVQALPSILSVDETVSNINIRGGSHDQNLILWDDIKMYQTGHFFGLISSFNPNMTQKASIINNGTDVSYTDGVSGTIHMQTENQVDSNFGGTFGLNFLSADIFSNIPIDEKSSLQIAARKSIDDLVRTPTYDVYYERVVQETEAHENILEVTNSNQEFSFYDTSLRWLFKPTDKDFFRLNFLLIDNNLSFNETANTNGSIETRESSVSQNSIVGGINYRREWNDNLYTILNIYETDYKLQAINADVIASQRFLQENIVSETGIKLEGVYNKNLWRFKLGYNFFETEVINLNDIDLPRFVRRDEEILREHSAYGQARFSNDHKSFSIRTGMRASYIPKFNKFLIEPRLSIRTSLDDSFDIELLGELKHQSTSQVVNFQNDFLGIEKRRWQLADNDNIPILESKQASFGVMYKRDGWLLDGKMFYKVVDGITTQSQSFTTKYEFEQERGSYEAFGVEFLGRKKFNSFNFWMSYSYIDNTYTFDTLEEIEFSSNFDITHSITFGTTYSNKSWNISAGMNYRTGKPTTTPLAEAEIVDNDINFSIANNKRLQDYLRIDASAIYKFKINNRFRSEVGASIWNLSNKKNAINNYYRVGESDLANKFSRFSLGLTTNAIIKLYF